MRKPQSNAKIRGLCKGILNLTKQKVTQREEM